MNETETTNSTASTDLYKQQRFFFMALDPIHIGTGGYRLGRVDMTIAREPGTNLPKIPGTSLAGAARSYAAMSYGRPKAAGQHKKYLKSLKETNKNAADCAILYTFGTAAESNSGDGSNDNGLGRAGTVSIGDARILFFPVASQQGPVWVSTPEILRQIYQDAKVELSLIEQPTNSEFAITNITVKNGMLNLGWLLLEAKTELILPELPGLTKDGKKAWEVMAKQLVLVTPKIFGQVVNSNLEVRTSVSIDPETGAAADKGLFTYEAVPRATWFWCDVIQDDYRSAFPKTDQLATSVTNQPTSPLEVVEVGFRLMEYLGVGGMGTRGFGRIKVVASPIIAQASLQEKIAVSPVVAAETPQEKAG